jgi:hypothetical protein
MRTIPPANREICREFTRLSRRNLALMARTQAVSHNIKKNRTGHFQRCITEIAFVDQEGHHLAVFEM